jgi:hypothetical protein
VKFTLPFADASITEWAQRYGTDDDDREAFRVGSAAKMKGALSRDDLLAIVRWKSPRPVKRCALNTDSYVRAVTASALATTESRFKIEALCLLDGVAWPTASVILHFCDAERWPIIDFRAFESLGVRGPVTHDFSMWQAYVQFARTTAERARVNMRALDRALWAYSKVNAAPSPARAPVSR